MGLSVAAASDPDFSALWNGAFVFSPCLVLLLSTVLDWDLERAMGMISGDTLLLFLLLWAYRLSRVAFFALCLWISSFWGSSIMGLCSKCECVGLRDGWTVLGRWMALRNGV